MDRAGVCGGSGGVTNAAFGAVLVRGGGGIALSSGVFFVTPSISSDFIFLFFIFGILLIDCPPKNLTLSLNSIE